MPNAKIRNYLLTPELLQRYRDAALENAQKLLDEATLLVNHKHYPKSRDRNSVQLDRGAYGLIFTRRASCVS